MKQKPPHGAPCVIHGGFVGFITGSLWLGLAETAIHWFIDDSKCRGRFGFHVDQLFHVTCKAVWAVFAVAGASS